MINYDTNTRTNPRKIEQLWAQLRQSKPYQLREDMVSREGALLAQLLEQLPEDGALLHRSQTMFDAQNQQAQHNCSMVGMGDAFHLLGGQPVVPPGGSGRPALWEEKTMTGSQKEQQALETALCERAPHLAAVLEELFYCREEHLFMDAHYAYYLGLCLVSQETDPAEQGDRHGLEQYIREVEKLYCLDEQGLWG